MNSFFRWATIIVVLGILTLGTGYFLWLREGRILSTTQSSTGLAAVRISVPAAAGAQLDVPVAARAQQQVEPTPTPTETVTPGAQPITATLTVRTPDARPAIIIMPPGSPIDAPEAATPVASPPATQLPTSTVTLEASPLLPVPTSTPEAVDMQSIVAPTPVATTDHTTTLIPDTRVTATVPRRFAPVPVVQLHPAEGPWVVPAEAQWLRPAPPAQLPESLAFGIPTPSVRVRIVAAPVVTALPAGPLWTPTPRPASAADLFPVPAAVAVQRYRAPDINALIDGSVTTQDALEIVARDTTGRWLLLVDGSWVQAATVQNPPAMLPLVVPTVTPTPTHTPLPLPTEEPPPTATPSPTPTPTPTSMDFAVCDCTPNTYACVTHHFPVRARAQACFEYCFRQTGRDVHNLDPDGNGLACENLPSP